MDKPHENSVKIEHADGKWLVLVFEAGETLQRDFETEEYALNFAAGQRSRLGLPPIQPD